MELCITTVRILVQVTIYRRLRIGRDDHLLKSEACDISYHVRENGSETSYLHQGHAVFSGYQQTSAMLSSAMIRNGLGETRKIDSLWCEYEFL